MQVALITLCVVLGLVGYLLYEANKELDKFFNDHEAQLKAKDDEIRRLNNLYADTIKDLGDALIEIERLKERNNNDN